MLKIKDNVDLNRCYKEIDIDYPFFKSLENWLSNSEVE